jgi:hypothetical protein
MLKSVKMRKTDKTKRAGHACLFYFLKPKNNVNAKEFAQQLISAENVKEVRITSGDFGFVVITKSGKNAVNPEISKSILDRYADEYSLGESHYTYRKRF